MTKPERFHDMAAVKRERERLQATRNERLSDLAGHWANLHEPALRRTLGVGMMKGALRAAFSKKGATDLLSMVSPEMMGGVAAMILGGRAKTTAGRAMALGLSAALPFVAGRFRQAGNGHLVSELETTWERVKAYVKKRTEARREQRSDEAQ